MLEITSLVGFLVLHFFVFFEEGMELMVEVNLSMLHGYEYLKLFFESEHRLESHILFFHEHGDVCSEGLYIAVGPVLKVKLNSPKYTYFINRDSNTVHGQLISSLGLSHQTHLLLNIA